MKLDQELKCREAVRLEAGFPLTLKDLLTAAGSSRAVELHSTDGMAFLLRGFSEIGQGRATAWATVSTGSRAGERPATFPGEAEPVLVDFLAHAVVGDSSSLAFRVFSDGRPQFIVLVPGIRSAQLVG